ncbi:MAG TPA: ABC transporter permease [Armatimonadota bacterium]|nr:ABC transporter permease [Armatimonadota bacterium]
MMLPLHITTFALWSLPEGWAVTLMSATLAFAVPLLLAGIGECVVERAGVINIGVEGLMLVAALASVVASHGSGSPWVGVGAGVVAAVALGALFGVLAVYRGVNQVVAGTAVNILALGLTGAYYGTLTQRLSAGGVGGRLVGVKLPDWPLSGLSSLPVLGPTLFSGNALQYLAFLVVPLSACLLYRTRPGLHLRAVGEHPRAAEAAGTDVQRTRLGSVLLGAALAGLAGAFLAVGHVVTFGENMIAGKGFIAMALVIYGRWSPWGVLAGAAVFSVAWGFATVLGAQGQGRPEEVILHALPYLAALGALVLRSGRTTAPAALAQPYG